MKKKSQASTEYIVIISLVFSMLLIIAAIDLEILSSGGERFRVTRAKHALDELASAAELVYQEGRGAQTKVYVTMPRNVIASSVRNQTLTINLSAMGSNRTLFRRLDFNVSGTIPTDSGAYWLEVESFGTYVNISNINTT